MTCNRSTRVTAVSALMLFLLFAAAQAFPQSAADGNSLKAIIVSFKFDPGPTYGGPRWTPPPYSGGLQAGQGAVEVKVQGMDASGKPVAITPEWTPADPEMVSVSPVRGDEFRITVKHPGDTKLKVSAQQISKELVIKAKSLAEGKAMKLEISTPEPGSGTPPAPAAVEHAPQAEGTAPVADQSSPFGTAKEKESYALGMNTGSQLRRRSIDVDSDLFMQGFKDSIAGGKTLLTDEDARALILNLRMEVKKKQVAQKQQLRAGGKLSDMKVAFKQESPPAGAPEGAESWVSPARYSVAQDTFQAKVQASLMGQVREIPARWIPADPEMVDITRGGGTSVRISVKRPGETKLTVASKGISKELTIKAKYATDNALQLEITQ